MLFLCMLLVCDTAGFVTAPPPPDRNGSRGALMMSPSKRGFFGGTLVKSNSDPIPESPSANSESPLLNSRISLSRVSEDRAMLSSSGAFPDIEKPQDKVCQPAWAYSPPILILIGNDEAYTL